MGYITNDKEYELFLTKELPSIWRKGKGGNYRKLITVAFGKVFNEAFKNVDKVSKLTSIDDINKVNLTRYASTVGIVRTPEDSDDAYFRDKIRIILSSRNTKSTIPGIIKSLQYVIGDEFYVKLFENNSGEPASIMISTNADGESLIKALELAKSFTPAGVSLVIPVLNSFTWQELKDQYPEAVDPENPTVDEGWHGVNKPHIVW